MSSLGKTQYYRSNDPLENLKFFISIREINRPKDFNSSDLVESQPFFTFKSVLSWQQKLFSPREIADYLHNKHDLQHRKGSPLQIETRSILARLEASGTDIQSLLQPVVFFTYIDGDRVQVEENFSTALSNPSVIDGRRKFRENSFKLMHFCLATDVQVEKMLQEKYGEYDQYYREHVLCSVKIFQDGVIEVSPALSKLILEPVNELPPDLAAEYHSALNPSSTSSVTAPSLFFSDHTVESGLRKGFRLSTMRVRSLGGSDYEYVLFNARDVLVPQQLEDLLLKQELMDSIRSSEVRGVGSQSITAQWKQDPSSRDFLYALQAEIVSAEGFEEGESLGITYRIYHPPSWQLRSGDITDGQMNPGTEGGSAANSRPMPTFNELESRGMLQGSTQVSRRSCGGYSIFHSDASSFIAAACLRVWYPSHLGRLLMGLAFWFVSILSVLEGVENGRLDVSPNKYHLSSKPNELRDSSNQIIFNFLMNYNFDVSDFKFEQQRLFLPTTQFAVVFMQVYSYSSPSWLFNRRRKLLGYASCQLPLTAGEFSLKCECWRPRGSIRHQLYDLFVGDSITLKDFTFPRDFDTITKTLNRFGVLSESMGTVHVRGHVIVTDAREVERRRKAEEEILIQQSNSVGGTGPKRAVNQRLNNFKTKKSVEEIMKSFKDSRLAGKETGKLTAASIINRLRSTKEAKDVNAGASSSNLSGTTRRPSIKSILESINANAKTSKTAEMVQRLRANKENSNEKRPLVGRSTGRDDEFRGRANEEGEDENASLLK